MASFFGFGKKKAKGQFIRSKKTTLPRGFAAHGPSCLNKDACEAEWTKGRDKAGNTYYWHAVRGIKAAYPGCGGYTMSPQGARDKHGHETTQPPPPTAAELLEQRRVSREGHARLHAIQTKEQLAKLKRLKLSEETRSFLERVYTFHSTFLAPAAKKRGAAGGEFEDEEDNEEEGEEDELPAAPDMIADYIIAHRENLPQRRHDEHIGVKYVHCCPSLLSFTVVLQAVKAANNEKKTKKKKKKQKE